MLVAAERRLTDQGMALPLVVGNVLSADKSTEDYRGEREQEKTEAVEAIEHALATIEGQRREPDKSSWLASRSPLSIGHFVNLNLSLHSYFTDI